MAHDEVNRAHDTNGEKSEPSPRKAWSPPVVILASAEDTAAKGSPAGDHTSSVSLFGS